MIIAKLKLLNCHEAIKAAKNIQTWLMEFDEKDRIDAVQLLADHEDHRVAEAMAKNISAWLDLYSYRDRSIAVNPLINHTDWHVAEAMAQVTPAWMSLLPSENRLETVTSLINHPDWRVADTMAQTISDWLELVPSADRLETVVSLINHPDWRIGEKMAANISSWLEILQPQDRLQPIQDLIDHKTCHVGNIAIDKIAIWLKLLPTPSARCNALVNGVHKEDWNKAFIIAQNASTWANPLLGSAGIFVVATELASHDHPAVILTLTEELVTFHRHMTPDDFLSLTELLGESENKGIRWELRESLSSIRRSGNMVNYQPKPVRKNYRPSGRDLPKAVYHARIGGFNGPVI